MNEFETDVIHDRFGFPALRLLNNGRLVDFNGLSLGFLQADSIFSYDGRHVGRYEYGVMRDNLGYVVGFGHYPNDDPNQYCQ